MFDEPFFKNLQELFEMSISQERVWFFNKIGVKCTDEKYWETSLYHQLETKNSSAIKSKVSAIRCKKVHSKDARNNFQA